MKGKLSLKLRLTVVTSLILTLACVIFTLFSIFRAQRTLIAVAATLPSISDSVPAAELNPSTAAYPANSIEMQLQVAETQSQIFSESSLWFMAGTIIIGSLVMYFAAGLILKPLKKLSSTIATVDTAGLHTTRIAEYTAKDELNTLADSFNAMMERLHTAFERERRFSADAAHELKTPLTVIKTTIEVLDEDAGATDCRQALRVVKKQTDRMTVLVRQLLEFSSMSHSSLTGQVEIDVLVGEVMRELCGEGAVMRLTPCTVRGDSVLLRQAVANLVQNALKYGDGTVEASVETADDAVCISIRDYGKGIPEEERARIFEPFYRIDGSRSRSLGGSGLGLSIVWEIARLHGGTVSCTGGVPTGTVFTIKIPENK